MLPGERLHLVVVDSTALLVDAVLHGFEYLAREIRTGAMGQVTAVGQPHAQQRVTRFEQRQIRRHVGRGARVWLHIGVVGAKQGLGPFHGQSLGFVHVLAAAIVTASRITLSVLVGEHRALGLQHPWAGIVLRRDELDVILLALLLGRDRSPQIAIEVRDITTLEHEPSRASTGISNSREFPRTPANARAESTVPESNVFFH